MKANKKLATSTVCKNVINKIFCGCSVTQLFVKMLKLKYFVAVALLNKKLYIVNTKLQPKVTTNFVTKFCPIKKQ